MLSRILPTLACIGGDYVSLTKRGAAFPIGNFWTYPVLSSQQTGDHTSFAPHLSYSATLTYLPYLDTHAKLPWLCLPRHLFIIFTNSLRSLNTISLSVHTWTIALGSLGNMKSMLLAPRDSTPELVSTT